MLRKPAKATRGAALLLLSCCWLRALLAPLAFVGVPVGKSHLLTLFGMTQKRPSGTLRGKLSSSDEAAGDVVLGLDFGTSGARLVAVSSSVDAESGVLFEASRRWSSEVGKSNPAEWEDVLVSLFQDVPVELRSRTCSIALDATSSTVMLVDEVGKPVTETRMYDWDVASHSPQLRKDITALLDEALVPKAHTVRAPTSTLSKVLAWLLNGSDTREGCHIMHQADFINSRLLGKTRSASDWHNALKLGFDVDTLSWPSWLREGPIAALFPASFLPEVVKPGTKLGAIGTDGCAAGLLPATCFVAAGTTDSIAAFLAAGASEPGDAVTSLGSTLAIKMLSKVKVEDASRGVYSHRLWQKAGDEALWLVGGASNVGCAVLRSEGFTAEELASLSADIDPASNSPYSYYPLTKPGERFPVCDPFLQPRLDPKPDSRKEYLHGILEGIANVEKLGYEALCELGSDQLKLVLSAGGGSVNSMWTSMRQRMLGVPVQRAPCVDAAAGAAQLARLCAAQREEI